MLVAGPGCSSTAIENSAALYKLSKGLKHRDGGFHDKLGRRRIPKHQTSILLNLNPEPLFHQFCTKDLGR